MASAPPSSATYLRITRSPPDTTLEDLGTPSLDLPAYLAGLRPRDLHRRRTPAASAAAAPDGTIPEVTPTATPTITFYKQLADEFMRELDEIAPIIPQLEAAHISTVTFVRSHLNVSAGARQGLGFHQRAEVHHRVRAPPVRKTP
jgi:hypothetical protein